MFVGYWAILGYLIVLKLIESTFLVHMQTFRLLLAGISFPTIALCKQMTFHPSEPNGLMLQ